VIRRLVSFPLWTGCVVPTCSVESRLTVRASADALGGAWDVLRPLEAPEHIQPDLVPYGTCSVLFNALECFHTPLLGKL
jgi:hypothetical protein